VNAKHKEVLIGHLKKKAKKAYSSAFGEKTGDGDKAFKEEKPRSPQIKGKTDVSLGRGLLTPQKTSKRKSPRINIMG